MFSPTYHFAYGAVTIMGIIFLSLLGTWIGKYRGGLNWDDGQFNYHPFLMCMGLVMCFSQAMLVFRTGKGFVEKIVLKIIHAVLHVAAFIFTVIGLYAIFDIRNTNNGTHLYSWHSWLGFFCVILYGLQFVAGFVTFLFPGLAMNIRKNVLPTHVVIGIGLFITVLVTCFMGLMKVDSYTKLDSESYTFNFTCVFLFIYGLGCLLLVIHPIFKRAADK